MGIGMMGVAMLMIMSVIMALAMVVMIMSVFGQSLHTALATIKAIAVAFAGAVFRRNRADAFHMVMVAFLG